MARLLYYFRNASFDFGFTALIIFTNIKMRFLLTLRPVPKINVMYMYVLNSYFIIAKYFL